MNPREVYEAVLRRALEHGLRRLEGIRDAPVAATQSRDQLRRRLHRPLQNEGVDPDRVIDELVADTRDGLIKTQGGRFFAWVIGGTLPASLGADMLTSLWDQNAALFATAPAQAVLEEVSGEWLKQLLGLPQSASFALVTGTQMAHVTCLAAARSHVLREAGWDVEARGLRGAPPVRVFASSEVHGSLDRAVRFLGLGLDSVRRLPVDDAFRMDPEALRSALEESDAPAIVHLEAGGINTGAFDRFEEIVPMAHEQGAWVHVDGAFGLWAAASPEYAHLMSGASTADSWSTDGHKWLNVPYDAGYAFVAHPERHRAAMSFRASYLAHADAARDQMDYNPEWSRRGRGAATYAAIRELGREGVATLVERTCQHAFALTHRLAELDGVELVWTPVINQGMVRFLDPAPGANQEDHDRYTEAVIERILEGGEAFFQATTFDRRRCVRVSVSSWMTDQADIDRTVAAVRDALATT